MDEIKPPVVKPPDKEVKPDPHYQATLLDIPPQVDSQVVVVRCIAALFSSLSLSLSTNATNRQMAAQALLAVGTVLFGLFGDVRGRFRRTRRGEPGAEGPPNIPGGGGG